MVEIHDNKIKSYLVDMENRKIIFFTVFDSNNIHEFTTIEFNNVMGHIFYNQIKGSIIFDITKYTVEEYLKKDDELFKDIEIYDFPFRYNNENELVDILNKNNQNYYLINSS
jgi:hypothetical protein